MSDYVMTIDSDDEDVPIPSSSKLSKPEPLDDAKLDPDFVFDVAGDPYVDFMNSSIGVHDLVKTGSKPVCVLHLHAIIMADLLLGTDLSGRNYCS